MSDLLVNGLLLPVLTAPPPAPAVGYVRLFVMNGLVQMIDSTGAVSAVTNV